MMDAPDLQFVREPVEAEWIEAGEQSQPVREHQSALGETRDALRSGGAGGQVRVLRAAAWLVAVAVLVAALGRLAPVVRDQIAAPFDLISEGPHLSTVKAIREGFNIYDPATVLDLPFHASPYTPLYHWLVAQLPQRPGNPFVTGRVVALLFMAGAAATLFTVVRREMLPAAMLALGCFVLLHPVTGNTAYLRSDSMALCCSVWAVVAAARGRRGGTVAAAVLATTAVAAKQSFYAAGGACVLFLLLERRTPLFLLVAGTTAALLALAATLRWGTGFWFCTTLPLTDYPRDWESFFVHWRMMFAQPIFVLLAVSAAGLLAITLWRAPRTLARSPYFPYMACSWVGQTLLMSGIGAENHNLIEPALATLLWALATLRDGRVFSTSPPGVVRAGIVAVICAIVFCVGLELSNPRWRDYAYTTPAHTAAYVSTRAEIRRALADLGLMGGQALNIKNSQVAHDFDVRINVNDPWMYITVLWQSRPETERRLTRAIETQYFDVVLTAPGLVSAAGQTLDNPTQRLIRTIFRHYRVARRGIEVNVLTRIPNAAADR